MKRALQKSIFGKGMEGSLNRLQLDYVDMVFCHRPDPFTPTETVVRAMTDIIRSGLATAWGTSEWSAQQITGAFGLPDSLDLSHHSLNNRSITCSIVNVLSKSITPCIRLHIVWEPPFGLP